MTYIILFLNLYKSGSVPEYERYLNNCISFLFLCQVEIFPLFRTNHNKCEKIRRKTDILPKKQKNHPLYRERE